MFQRLGYSYNAGFDVCCKQHYLQYSRKTLSSLFEAEQKELKFLGFRRYSLAEGSLPADVTSRDGDFTVRDHSSYNSMYAEKSKDSAVTNGENSPRTS